MLKIVSQRKEIKPGFIQSAFREEKVEILLSTILKGTGLDEHSHEHIQYGYCFSGSFNFKYINQSSLLTSGKYYLLKSYIEHSAEALEDFYALDFKYIPSGSIVVDELKSHICCKGCSDEKINVGENFFYKITATQDSGEIRVLDQNYRAFLVTCKNEKVIIDDIEYELEPMNVYEHIFKEQSEICLKHNTSIYVILVKREEAL